MYSIAQYTVYKYSISVYMKMKGELTPRRSRVLRGAPGKQSAQQRSGAVLGRGPRLLPKRLRLLRGAERRQGGPGLLGGDD